MRLKDYLMAIISGFLLMLSFPGLINMDLSGRTGFLAFFGLVPLLTVLEKKDSKQLFILGLITGFIYLGGAVSWLTNMKELGVLAFPCWVLLGLYPALYIGAFAFFTGRAGLAFAPFIWTGLELLRSHLFGGFPWALLGYSQFTALPVIQISDITGVYGVSFLLVLINTGFASVFVSGGTGKLKKFLPLAVGLFLLVGFIAYGFVKLNQFKEPVGKQHLISVIQANVSQPEKWDPNYAEAAFSRHETLSESVKKEMPEVIIWPETATAMYVKHKPEYMARLSKLARYTSADLLIGTPDAVPDKDFNVAEAYNSVMHLSKEGKVLGLYAKMHLVPFGEFVPFEKQLKFLEKFTAGFNKWDAGKEPVIFLTSGGLKIATPVCWEVIFPADCRKFVKLGAGYLLTVSNDGWYGVSAAPYQHFMVLPFRAVENRVSVGRAANTVVSGFVDYTGRIKGTLKQDETNTLTAGLFESVAGLTFYTRFGDLFSWVCVLIAAFGVVTGHRLNKGKNAK